MPILLAIAATTMVAPSVEQTDAMFAAAGATRRGKSWVFCREDPRAFARIDLQRDVNRDGREDVIIVEDSARCYGGSERSFVLLGGLPGGKWKKMFGTIGVPDLLEMRRGVGNWPDISIGGPGFCFPVVRWNGREYANHRREYQGKPCR